MTSLSHPSYLTIADVRFASRCDGAVEDTSLTPAYEAFIGEETAVPDVEVPVTLFPHAFTGLSGMARRWFL